MKKYLFLIGAALLVFCTSCVKEKNCRCSVLHSNTVRIITINKGDCSQLNYASYHDALDTLHIDSILCTDYPFEADSLIVNI
ncbi:MAG: hypothetical protein MJZ77_08660 [Bacteroidales bacterium]|nr:hypothetical protein [Bacteroidales bacterium]